MWPLFASPEKETRTGVDFLYIEVDEYHCTKLLDLKIYLYSPQKSTKS
jgi:hypothetical protein